MNAAGISLVPMSLFSRLGANRSSTRAWTVSLEKEVDQAMAAPPFRTPLIHFDRYAARPGARAVPWLEPARRRAGQQTRRER